MKKIIKKIIKPIDIELIPPNNRKVIIKTTIKLMIKSNPVIFLKIFGILSSSFFHRTKIINNDAGIKDGKANKKTEITKLKTIG